MLLMSTMSVPTSSQSSINVPHPPAENRIGNLFVDDVLCPDEMKDLHGKMFPTVQTMTRSKTAYKNGDKFWSIMRSNCFDFRLTLL